MGERNPSEIPLDFRQDVIKFLSFHISLLCRVGRVLTIILEKHLVRETFWWIFLSILETSLAFWNQLTPTTVLQDQLFNMGKIYY